MKGSQEWVSGSRLRAEETPPSFLDQVRKSWGENPKWGAETAQPMTRMISSGMTLSWDLMKRPHPGASPNTGIGCPGPLGGRTHR